MEGDNYNQKLVVHLPDEICRTIIGSGHSGNESKVIILVNEDDSICRKYGRKTN